MRGVTNGALWATLVAWAALIVAPLLWWGRMWATARIELRTSPRVCSMEHNAPEEDAMSERAMFRGAEYGVLMSCLEHRRIVDKTAVLVAPRPFFPWRIRCHREAVALGPAMPRLTRRVLTDHRHAGTAFLRKRSTCPPAASATSRRCTSLHTHEQLGQAITFTTLRSQPMPVAQVRREAALPRQVCLPARLGHRLRHVQAVAADRLRRRRHRRRLDVHAAAAQPAARRVHLARTPLLGGGSIPRLH